jgi:hypothetical protein
VTIYRSAALGILAAALPPFAFLPAVECQHSTPTKTTISSEQNGSVPHEGDGVQSSPREEMLKSLEIRRRDAAYQDKLEKAKECAQIGADLKEIFERQKGLVAADFKKLNRLEKLARSIREEAGGDDDSAAEEMPRSLEEAIRRLAGASEELRKRVEKTPKHVVSAAVIAEANQLLGLIRHVKTLGGQ